MRAVLVVVAVIGSNACSCKDETPAVVKPVAVSAPVAAVAASDAAKKNVSVAWMQQVLTPTRFELAARIEYGPTTAPVTVQLALPEGLAVVRGRTYFTLEPSTEPRTHVEPYSMTAPSLPVKDLALTATLQGVSVTEPYKFGRH